MRTRPLREVVASQDWYEKNCNPQPQHRARTASTAPRAAASKQPAAAPAPRFKETGDVHQDRAALAAIGLARVARMAEEDGVTRKEKLDYLRETYPHPEEFAEHVYGEEDAPAVIRAAARVLQVDQRDTAITNAAGQNYAAQLESIGVLRDKPETVEGLAAILTDPAIVRSKDPGRAVRLAIDRFAMSDPESREVIAHRAYGNEDAELLAHAHAQAVDDEAARREQAQYDALSDEELERSLPAAVTDKKWKPLPKPSPPPPSEHDSKTDEQLDQEMQNGTAHLGYERDGGTTMHQEWVD